MRRRFVAITFLMCIMLSSTLSASALNYVTQLPHNTELAWFAQHGINTMDISRIMESVPNGQDQLKSLSQQARANNLTPAQVQEIVRSMFDAPPLTREGMYGQLSKDGTTIALPNGMTTPNLQKQRMLDASTSTVNATSETGLTALTSGYRDVVDFSDQSGVFWLVRSTTGFNQATTFVNLPHITTLPTSPDRPYVFFAVNNATSSVVGDYGIVFYPNSGWHLFSYTLVWNTSTNRYDATWWQSSTPLPSQYVGGSSVYLHVQITNTSNTDSVSITLRDGITFSTLFSRTVSFINNPFNSTLSNVNIYRQITMAQVLTGPTLNTNTGTHMANARTSAAHLYSPVGYWLWGTSQTSDTYRKAPTSVQLATVIVNSHTRWHAEDISIRFNIP
ncbi:MAG: hypothetical protein KGZ64_10330 [Thermaerobacter sp.]|nr:hypothetical protein [Thermaerobacter sp.]